MGLKEVLEEIETLRAIFCKDGEFTLHSDLECLSDSNCFSITFSIRIGAEEADKDKAMSVIFSPTVNENYPRSLEGFSLNSAMLKKSNLNEMRVSLQKYIDENLLNCEDPFIMDIVQWMQEHAFLKATNDREFIDVGKSGDTKRYKCVVLKLDHMRSKQKYTRLILSWMDELALRGRVVFHRNAIWIGIHGQSESVKEYLKRHKTCNVDVDSSGRPCKERKMNVIIDRNAENSQNLYV